MPVGACLRGWAEYAAMTRDTLIVTVQDSTRLREADIGRKNLSHEAPEPMHRRESHFSEGSRDQNVNAETSSNAKLG